MSKKRSKAPIYSIVDLETTGTSVKHGDRIIQIGCVLMQDGKIINSFETKINPLMKIPHSIEQLTGIKNSDVQDSPLFDDVAATMTSLLSDTIFVAHNVNFDFPFLNHELNRCGFPDLKIPAIDTVTLSQILFPTARSYRLRDLTRWLKITHNHPHSAVSDAEATARLLDKLLDRVRHLPAPTLQHLAKMKLKLPRQTASVFKFEYKRKQSSDHAIDDDHFVCGDLVLHKIHPAATAEKPSNLRYPMTKRQKLRLFNKNLVYRPVQSRMMNSIYNYFGRDGINQVILEAGTGVGKTLGYLLPLSYLTYPRQKIVVSTATNVLQKQIMGKPMQQLNAVLPFPMKAVMVKGNQHYINLAKFAHSLSVDEDSQLAQLLKAQVLVWLVDTTTGDLDELNLNSQRSPFFTEVRHHGLKSLKPNSPYYKADFLVQRERHLQAANIIVTNHAYLVAHARELGAVSPLTYLVVDEAQHLSSSVLQHSRDELAFQQMSAIINSLQDLVNENESGSLLDVFDNLPLGSYNLQLIETDLHRIRDAFNALQASLFERFITDAESDEQGFIEQQVDNQELAALLDPNASIMLELESGLASLQLHFTALRHLFENRDDSWLASDRYLMNQFASQMSVLLGADESLHRINQTLAKNADTAVYWLNVRQASERSTMKLTGGLLVADHYLRENVYAYFYRQLFVGATLFSSQRSKYIYQQLDLDPQKVNHKRLPEAFDFAHQAVLLAANDAPEPDDDDYLDYLSRTIYQIANENHCQTIVLFNSLVTIEQVYGRLHKTPLFDQRDILAQGIDGSREKILKQFSLGKQSVLLGAGSFWEGIDLPSKQLQLLIITRLPFDSPDEVYTKAEHQLLRAQGKSPFYHSALPKVIIRMRQGIGRLLRSSKDYGAAVVLDPRLLTRRYGKSIRNALPDALPFVPTASQRLSREVKNFLKKHQRPNQHS